VSKKEERVREEGLDIIDVDGVGEVVKRNRGEGGGRVVGGSSVFE